MKTINTTLIIKKIMFYFF